MKILECLQGSPEWFEFHRGIATASQFDKIITPKTGKLSAAADDYIAQKVAEKVGAFSMMPDQLVSKAMLHGIETEPEARNWYSMVRDVDVRQVGFVTTDDGRFGCSPDGMVEEDGTLELKCPQPKTHVSYLLDGVLPSEYAPQVHGQLYVTGRKWVDFVSYAVGFPPLVLRVVPDAYTAKLGEALEAFWKKYQEALAKIEAMKS